MSMKQLSKYSVISIGCLLGALCFPAAAQNSNGGITLPRDITVFTNPQDKVFKRMPLIERLRQVRRTNRDYFASVFLSQDSVSEDNQYRGTTVNYSGERQMGLSLGYKVNSERWGTGEGEFSFKTSYSTDYSLLYDWSLSGRYYWWDYRWSSFVNLKYNSFHYPSSIRSLIPEKSRASGWAIGLGAHRNFTYGLLEGIVNYVYSFDAEAEGQGITEMTGWDTTLSWKYFVTPIYFFNLNYEYLKVSNDFYSLTNNTILLGFGIRKNL
jgi:hypothetical protein